MTKIVELVLAKPSGRVPAGGGGNEPQYPQKPSDELLRMEMLELRNIRAALGEAHGDLEFEMVERRAEPLSSSGGAGLREAIEQELQLATIDDVRGQVALLIECRREFRDVADKDIFWLQMTERVCALQPSVGALRFAFKRVINEPRPQYRPKTEIADVLELVKDEQLLRERAAELLDEIPQLTARRRAKIDAETERRRQSRLREKEMVRGILSRPAPTGPLDPMDDISMFDQEVIAEVRTELGLAS